MISNKIVEIRANIKRICFKIGQDPSDVILVGVTKYTDVGSMAAAIAAGLTDFGENRVQNAKQKFVDLEGKGIEFKRHMIGHLQINKVKDAVALFDMIQSVDSLKVAREIDKQAAKLDKVMDVLVQINSSHEEQKSGIAPNQTIELLEEISVLEHVRVLGLMTIGLFTDDQEKITECFRLTRSLFDEANEKFKENVRVEMTYLSMGMTQDYELAIEYGANMVRIGSGIFN